MYVDGYVILFAYTIMCISVGIAVYALLKVIDIEATVNRLKKQSTISTPRIERKIKSPWNK